jgi:Protein of unknown function (DUF3800)
MFVFIDDSGDVGVPGMRPYFALSAVVFQTEEERDGAGHAVHELRKKWGRADSFELKFWNLRPQLRTEFFVRIGDMPFRYASCVLWKDRVSGRRWRDRRYVYERVIRGLVGELVPYLREADAAQDKPLKVGVVADEHDDPDYWRLLKAEFYKLRSKDGSGMVKGKVRPGKSSSSNVLQFADLVCGAARWDTDAYRKFIAVQCLKICILP